MHGSSNETSQADVSTDQKLEWSAPVLQTLAALDNVLSGPFNFTDGSGGYSS